MQRVFLQPHDPQWADEFARESAEVARALGEALVAIHHIGSTAIPGIAAKPVIDMLAVAEALAAIDAAAPKLAALGYEAMGEFGLAGRRYFRKDNAAGERTHQIHTFQAGSPQVARHLAFRDYLRAHPETALAYERLKRQLAEEHSSDVNAYTDGKNMFIEAVDARAKKWRKAG
jgi:GrpB-like predicted nucleotidyltransferase (UPF0157 family)